MPRGELLGRNDSVKQHQIEEVLSQLQQRVKILETQRDEAYATINWLIDATGATQVPKLPVPASPAAV